MWHPRPPRDPPFMANAILNFHFDFLTTSLICNTFQKSKNNYNNSKPGKKQENHGACQGLSQGPPGQAKIVIFSNAEDTRALFDYPTKRICASFFIFSCVVLCSMTKLKEHILSADLDGADDEVDHPTSQSTEE